MKQIVLMLIVLLFVNCSAQQQKSKFNLDFEQNNRNGKLADDWLKWGNYEIEKDTVNVFSGCYSSLIISDESGSSFGSIAYKIPAKYNGSSISLEGYMKIENVENGFAGLLLRIDGNAGTLAFDNMQNQSISGSKNWQKYSIKLPYFQGAENIYVAGILTGKGKAWFDDFVLKIDGNDVQTLKENEKQLSKTQFDKEFDDGSNFKIKEINEEQIERLYKLGKVWGYLKYHHPKVARGEVNWDNELFRILPQVYAENFNIEVFNWIKQLGELKENTDKESDLPANNVKLWPNTNWISDNSFLDEKIREELNTIDNSRKESSNYYVSFQQGVGNPIFQNEKSYPNMKWDDTGYQLLALFRYWNIIEYFYPYKNLLDKNWDGVLKDYISEIVSCTDELSYKLTILSLIGEIHDTHANIWQQDVKLNHFFGNKIIPLKVQFVDNEAVVVGIPEETKNNYQVKVGDIIKEINGIKIEKIVSEKIKYCPASNYTTQLRDVSKKLLKTNDEIVTLTIENQMGTFREDFSTIPVNSFNFENRDIPSHSEFDDEIGYIYPGSLQAGEIDEIMGEFLDKKGIIIDLRCYPSDFIVFSLGKYLMPEPTEFVKFTATNLSNPGLFMFSSPLTVGEKNRDYFKGDVIILINEQTQSQAEYTTMALRVAPKAIVIGNTTAGADGNVSAITLPGNISTMISGIGVYYPDGSETQRIGIIPDIEIVSTVKGIREGIDELLEKAIAVLNEN